MTTRTTPNTIGSQLESRSSGVADGEGWSRVPMGRLYWECQTDDSRLQISGVGRTLLSAAVAVPLDLVSLSQKRRARAPAPHTNYSPPTIRPSIRMVGQAMAPRNSRSLAISEILKNISLRLPATVISSTG